MGGGDVASSLAVAVFRDYVNQYGVNHESMLLGARAAHNRIREVQMSSDVGNRMATTLTAVALSRDGIIGVHCGDSRAVIARRNGIKRLTKDHSEGQRLFDANKLSKEEFANYERKHILESALGDREDPQIDSFSFDLLPGDRVLLTTDGVHNLVLLREMQRLSSTSPTPSDLIKRVASIVGERGPSDNYSMIALYAA
jgi:protein phosphatase